MESNYHRTCSILLLELFYISQPQVQDYPVSKHKGANQTGGYMIPSVLKARLRLGAFRLWVAINPAEKARKTCSRHVFQFPIAIYLQLTRI